MVRINFLVVSNDSLYYGNPALSFWSSKIKFSDITEIQSNAVRNVNLSAGNHGTSEYCTEEITIITKGSATNIGTVDSSGIIEKLLSTGKEIKIKNQFDCKYYSSVLD